MSILDAPRYKEFDAGAPIERKRCKDATTREYIKCPVCRSSTRKIASLGMGGLEVRKCRKNGHEFEFDRWIADRLFWKDIL